MWKKIRIKRSESCETHVIHVATVSVFYSSQARTIRASVAGPAVIVLVLEHRFRLVQYLGKGENIGTCRGVVELLELVVILLF